MTKYRIWDKFNKEFIDLEHTDRNLSIDPISGKVMETEISTGELDNYLSDWLVPVVFTGLHDKHGKEIYEDDFLKSKHGQIGRVYYFCDSYLIHWIKENYESNLRKCTDCEVVGNIYENPELLDNHK